MAVDYILMGKRLAERRKSAGLTQEQLAEMAELTNNYISNIENGRSVPSVETLVDLCEALRTTPDAILSGVSLTSPEYMRDEIQQQLDRCLPHERRLISGFISLLLTERNS